MRWWYPGLLLAAGCSGTIEVERGAVGTALLEAQVGGSTASMCMDWHSEPSGTPLPDGRARVVEARMWLPEITVMGELQRYPGFPQWCSEDASTLWESSVLFGATQFEEPPLFDYGDTIRFRVTAQPECHMGGCDEQRALLELTLVRL